jgi:hypothetical protein
MTRTTFQPLPAIGAALLAVVTFGSGCAEQDGSEGGPSVAGTPGQGETGGSSSAEAGLGGIGPAPADNTDQGGAGSQTPPSKAGTSFQPTTGGCNLTTGLIVPEGGQPTTQTLLGARVADGMSGADVDCTVSPTGDGYQVFGAVQQGMRSFTVEALVAPSANEGEKFSGLGTIYQFDSPTSTNLQSDRDACSITVLENQDIAGGRVWGSFTCETVRNPGAPGIECSASGSFVFENCDE